MSKETPTTQPPVAARRDTDAIDKVDIDADIKEVEGNLTYLEAVSAAPLNPWSKISIMFYFIFLVAALNATSSGFDGSIFSSVNAMTQYQEYFGNRELGSNTGVIMMLYPAGNMVGALFSGPINDMFGRRIGMGCGSLLIITGAIILTAAQNNDFLRAGRFVLGMGVGIGTSAAPTYAIELSPPQWRGRVVGFYNTFFFTGSILSTGVAYGAGKLKGEVAFRFPLGLQLLPPTLVFLGVWFIPESPRWLTAKGRHADAAKILAKYHGAGDVNHPIVQLEIREFEENIKQQSTQSAFDFWCLVENHAARWRMSMNLLISLTGQLAGNSVLTYYMPSMYTVLGITSTERRLLLTFANSICSCFSAVVGSSLNDRLPRRTRFWIGSLVNATLFSAVTGFSSQFPIAPGRSNGSALSNAGVASIFFFGMGHSFVYTPLSPTYSAEVLDNHMRAKGMGVKIIANNIVNLYNTYVTAVAMDAISWRYYFLFIALNLVWSVTWYIFGVETRGRTLEELKEVFEAKWPPKASLDKKKVADLGNGRLQEVEDA